MSENNFILSDESRDNTPTTDEILIQERDEDPTDMPVVRTRSDRALDIFDFLEMLILSACAIMLLFSFVARLSSVDGNSMNHTLEHGDKLIVSDLFYTPTQGDIVVFQDTNNQSYHTAIVKRVIAVGGQTVQLTYTPNGNLNLLSITVDGKQIEEPYRLYDLSMPPELVYRYEGTYTYKVPEGCVFVLGDNTYNSEDSRGSFGYVDEDKIIGRVVFRLCGANLSSLFDKFGAVA